MEQNTTLGMCTFDQCLMDLYVRGLITEETAMSNSDRPSDLKIKLHQHQLSTKNNKGEKGLTQIDTSRIKFGD